MHNKNITNINTLLFSIHCGTADLFLSIWTPNNKKKIGRCIIDGFQTICQYKVSNICCPWQSCHVPTRHNKTVSKGHHMLTVSDKQNLIFHNCVSKSLNLTTHTVVFLSLFTVWSVSSRTSAHGNHCWKFSCSLQKWGIVFGCSYIRNFRWYSAVGYSWIMTPDYKNQSE
jgi:hypothetical protein